MKTIRKYHIFCFLLTNVLTLNACSDKSSKPETSISQSIPQVQKNLQQDVNQVNSELAGELEKAKKEGKAVFVVVTENESVNTNKALEIAKEAKNINNNSIIVQMNRDDASNSKFVTQWRLTGAPLPLILVLSSKGVPSGGYILEQATAENIAALIPSPKLETVYDAIEDKKHTILVFTKKTFSDKSQVENIAREAVSLLNDQAVFVEVDMDDPKESSFLNQLRIDKNSAKNSITMVINKQGQVAGKSSTLTDASSLVATANTPVASGCASGCGPAGCGN